MKNNPDDRSDNVERIQRNINSTLENINLANEMMSKTDDQKTIKDLEERNKRREKSLKGLRKEIKDEAIANEIKEEVLSKEISIKKNENYKTSKKVIIKRRNLYLIFIYGFFWYFYMINHFNINVS